MLPGSRGYVKSITKQLLPVVRFSLLDQPVFIPLEHISYS
jgi:hypothetical protein